MYRLRLDEETDVRALCNEVGGLYHPLEAADIDNDLPVNALKGNRGNDSLKHALFDGNNVNVLGADNNVNGLIFAKALVNAFKGVTGKSHLKVCKLPEGELKTPFKGNPLGEAAVRVEQPRGEVLYYLRGNGTDKLDRLRIRTPTFANIAPLLSMLVGCSLPDVAVIILSVDPCISCTER